MSTGCSMERFTNRRNFTGGSVFFMHFGHSCMLRMILKYLPFMPFWSKITTQAPTSTKNMAAIDNNEM